MLKPLGPTQRDTAMRTRSPSPEQADGDSPLASNLQFKSPPRLNKHLGAGDAFTGAWFGTSKFLELRPRWPFDSVYVEYTSVVFPD